MEFVNSGPLEMPAPSKAMEALRRLNYQFNSDLQLRHTQTGQAFKFIDQAHYEEIADAVADYIQEVMLKEYDMVKLDLPFHEDLDEIKEEDYYGEEIIEHLRCPIYASSNYKEAETVMILLCGTGRVASGQWARKLCINDSLKVGSVLPFLDWAKEHSFGVLVLNPNKNTVETKEGRLRIPFNGSSEAHFNYVWMALCKKLPAKHFLLVAHSYGGISTLNLLEEHGEEVLERLRCIAFTDSIHTRLSSGSLLLEVEDFLSNQCINWASSLEPLDTVLDMPRRVGSVNRETDGKGRTGDGYHGSMDADVDDQENGKETDCSTNAPDVGGDTILSTSIRNSQASADMDSCRLEQTSKERKRSKASAQKTKISDWFVARDCMCKVVSAGTNVHELTTMSAFPSICKFLLESGGSRGTESIEDQEVG